MTVAVSMNHSSAGRFLEKLTTAHNVYYVKYAADDSAGFARGCKALSPLSHGTQAWVASAIG